MGKNINPHLKKYLQGIRKTEPTAKEFAAGILRGDRNYLSKAITKLESSKHSEQELAEEIIKLCHPYSGNSRRIGITGVPGVGKSTFIDIFGEKLIKLGNKIAILAIDPSSSISGGSILGDKTRMESLSGKIQAFIRPSPSAGTLGGVAAKTRESIILCEAAGFDTILVETVGVGQSEIAVSSMVDVFMMLLVAGTGDELQGIKRGIMEMVDILVFTKNDGDNMNRTAAAARQFKTALRMFPSKESAWTPDVLSASAYEQTGFEDILETLNSYFSQIRSNNYLTENRKNQAVKWLNDQIIALLKDNFYKDINIAKELKGVEQQVINQQISPIMAAKMLVNKHFN